MKKISNSKRGFTLTEIIVVVAIIVIVSAAAFVGIAITINNAKTNAERVNERHGQDSDGKELFEAEAWDAVDSLAKGAAKFFDVATYDPDDKPKEPEDNTPTDGDLTVDGGSTGGGGGDSDTLTPTKPATATNTPGPTNTPVPTTPPPPPETSKPGTVTTISGTTTQTNLPNANAPENNYYTWDKPVIETKVSVPGGSGYSTVTIVIKYSEPVTNVNSAWNGDYKLSGDKKTMTITTSPGSDFGVQAYTNGTAEVVSIMGS